MKKVLSILFIALLAFGLFGCGSSNSSSDAKDIIVKAEEYIASDPYKDLYDLNDDMSDLISTASAGNYSKATKIYPIIAKTCDSVIDATDVPEGAVTIHEYMVQAATNQKEAAHSYYYAAGEDKITKQTEYIKDGNNYMEEATKNVNKANGAITELNELFNAVTSE